MVGEVGSDSEDMERIAAALASAESAGMNRWEQKGLNAARGAVINYR